MQAYLVYLIISLHMIQYTSQYQTKIDDFSSLHQLKLNPNNRWIQLSFILPWDNLVKIYSKKFNQSSGAKAISPRIIIGALIIKHKLNLSDEETLQTISENPYMQFFLGLDDYSPEILFSPSLFVEIRKRLGQDTFNEFSELIMSLSLNPSSTQKGDEQPSNQGKLKIDATVADQYIRYPNDLSLVNEARLKSEKIIDQLYILLKDEFNYETNQIYRFVDFASGRCPGTRAENRI
jgi:IS5 family transposase